MNMPPAATGSRSTEAHLGPPIGTDELFCLCQRRYTGEMMLLCDSCAEWYHPECIGLLRTRNAHTTHFVCPTCKKLEEIRKARQATQASVGLRTPAPAIPTVFVAEPPRPTPSPPPALLTPEDVHAQIESEVSRLVEDGVVTMRELSSALEKSSTIAWATLAGTGRHWKRDLIRAAFHKFRPDQPISRAAPSPPPSTTAEEPTGSPPPKRQRNTPSSSATSSSRTPASRSSGTSARPNVLHQRTTRLAQQAMRQRTRPRTHSARFKGEYRTTASEEDSEPEAEVKGSRHCLCKKTWDGSFMVRCDACRLWFHPKCLGLRISDCNQPGHFYCPKCRRRK